MKIIVKFETEDGTSIGQIEANQKDFKTGSRGFHGQGKVELQGKRYQTQVQMVEIGSKPQAAGGK